MKNQTTICKASIIHSQASTIGKIPTSRQTRAIGEIGVKGPNESVGVDGYNVSSISMFKMSYVGSINSIFGSVVGKTG